MQNSPSLIEQIKEQADLVTFVRDTLGVDLKKKGREWVGLCPMHQERSPSFFVNPEKQVCLCRGCGAGGDIISLVEHTQNLAVGDAIVWLARHYGIDIPEKRRPRPATRPSSSTDSLEDLTLARQILATVADYYRDALSASTVCLSYLEGRQIGNAEIIAYQLGYAPSEYDLVTEVTNRLPDTPLPPETVEAVLRALGLIRYNRQPFFQDRLMFPVADSAGSVAGFSGRRMNNETDSPKYINSPDSRLFQKKSLLYGLAPFTSLSKEDRRTWQDLIRQSVITVVEGYTDVIAMARHGLYAVATMGTAMTDEHLKLLQRRSVDDIVFCFDGDRAGRDAAWRVTEKVFDLIADGDAWSVKLLPDGQDVDDLLNASGVEAFKAVPTTSCSHYWLSQSLQPIRDNDTLENRVRLWRDLSMLRQRMSERAPVLASLMEGEIQRQLGPTPLPLAGSRGGKAELPSWHGRALHPAVADMIRLVSREPTTLINLPAPRDAGWSERRYREPDEVAFAGLKLVLFAQHRLGRTILEGCNGTWGLLQALSEAGMPSDWLRAWAQAAPPACPPAVSRQRRSQLIEQWGAFVELACRQQQQYPIWSLVRLGR